MGNILASPYLDQANTEKETEFGQDDDNLKWAVSSMQGWRRNMEDSHVAEGRKRESVNTNKTAIFSVFDGHGGREVALFCQKYFVKELSEMDEYKNGDYGEAIRRVYHHFDEILEGSEKREEVLSLKHPTIPPAGMSTDDNEDEGIDGDDDGDDNKTLKLDGKDQNIQKILKNFIKNAQKEREESESTAKAIGDKDSDSKVTSSDSSTTISSSGFDIEVSEEKEQDEMHDSDDDYEDITEDVEVSGGDSKKVDNTQPERNICNLDEHVIQAGCTAVTCILDKEKIVVGWVGDSRAVLCKDGHAVALSIDHKPNSQIERARIVKAGGFVQEMNGQYRVNGNLNLSRALGDLKYKQSKDLSPAEQAVTGEPDITVTKRESGHEFLILACDGIWDVKTNQQAVDFVRSRIEERGDEPETLSKITEELLDDCVAESPIECKGLGCDNMTCIIISFKSVGKN